MGMGEERGREKNRSSNLNLPPPTQPTTTEREEQQRRRENGMEFLVFSGRRVSFV
ncbi:hypothetical protein LguiA_035591 [Lonicera macranthoides]